MNPSKMSALLKILVLSQIGSRRQRGGRFSIKGVLSIGLAAFFISSASVYLLLGMIPEQGAIYFRAISLEALSFAPAVALAFIVIYGVLFVIGDSAQYASSEMVNYMPISPYEYVLASSFSTVISYNYILTAVLGVSLALSLRFGLIWAWAVSALVTLLCAVLGGFISEIIKSAVNRVSSSFSRKSGRAAIASRAVLIVLILAFSQVLFNPNILLRLLELIAPQIQTYWFVPLVWPSIVVMESSAGNLPSAVLFSALTLIFGGILLLSAVALRSRYWVPLPVTIELKPSGSGKYGRQGGLSATCLSRAESAMLLKDIRSLSRRKEMVRFWSLPFIMLIPLLFSFGAMSRYELYSYLGMISAMGTGFFALFTSAMSLGQEGRAIWRIFSSPVAAGSVFKVKAILPLSLSILLAFGFTGAFTLVFSLGYGAALALLVLGSVTASIAVGVGLFFGAKYPELDEKPRSSFITGTGILLAMAATGVSASISVLPLFLHVFFGILPSLYQALAICILLGAAIAVFFFAIARAQFRQFFSELPQ